MARDPQTPASSTANAMNNKNDINNNSYFPTVPRRPPPLLVEPAQQTSQCSYVPRAISTRMQLQRQRLQDRHASIVIAQRMPPGLKTSTAFFASLRTNLQLNASPPPPSPLGTPSSLSASTGSLPPPSPLAIAQNISPSLGSESPLPPASPAMFPEQGLSIPSIADDPLAGVPELVSYIATSQSDRLAAVRLIYDAAVQMRGEADTALLLHFSTILITILMLSAVAHLLHSREQLDWSSFAVWCTAIILSLFVMVRWMTDPYLQAAKRISHDWLETVADDVMVTRFGDEIVAALAIAWVPGTPGSSSSGRRRSNIKGEIQAWTVRDRYRGKGVGAALLDEAARLTRRRGASDLEFAADHAYSIRALPKLFNRAFDRREEAARQALIAAVDANGPPRSRRRRGGSG